MGIDGNETEAASTNKGLSRRQMIKASAAAGAVAWTAPVIIDSLSSPAAAFSNCHKKYIKFQPNGVCCTFNPACATRDSGALLTCTGGANTCSGTSLGALAPTFDFTTNASYYIITLPKTCGFDPTKFASGSQWAVEGNTSNTCTSVPAKTVSDPNPPTSGDGYYIADGQTAYLLKTKGSTYIYIQYCCSA